MAWIFILVLFILPVNINGQDDTDFQSSKPEMLMNQSLSEDFFKSLQISVIEHPVFLSSEANLAQSSEVLNIAKAPR